MDYFERDKELSKKVYKLYISTDSMVEYLQKLKELSISENVDKKYLQRLLEEFDRMYATKQEKEEIKKIKKRNHEKKYVKFVENMMEMSEEELREYIKALKMTDIKINFNNFINNSTDKSLIKKVEELLNHILEIYEQLKDNKKQNQKNQTYKLATEMFDEIVNNGYFSISQYRQEKFREYGISEDQFQSLAEKYFYYLKNNHSEKFEYYKQKMEQNKKITYCNLKSKIDEMIEKLPDKYDIIEFYINIGLTPTAFKKLCNGLINKEDEIKIKIFFTKYSESNYPVSKVYDNIAKIKKKEIVIEFMKQYHIPLNYFFICHKKYKNGRLDEQIKSSKK